MHCSSLLPILGKGNATKGVGVAARDIMHRNDKEFKSECMANLNMRAQ